MSTGKPSGINWGIIGPGKIAGRFADDLQYVPNARLHAVASTNAERVQAFGNRYGVPHVYDRYEDILQCPDLDVVYIATPHTFHCQNTLMCLEAGLSVLCEKPFAINAADARRMVESARRNNVFLMDALWTRFIPATQKAFELIENGAIGAVHTVQSDFGFCQPFDPNSRLFNMGLGGGSLLDIGIYNVLLSLFVLGVPRKEDILATATFASTGADDSCVFIFRYDGDRLATGHSTIRSNTPTEATIYGTKGHIVFASPWHHTRRLTLVQYEGREQHRTDIELPHKGGGYQFEAAHVTGCLLQGKRESDLIPWSFSISLMETLDAIRMQAGLNYDKIND
jgi:predicted dehydrogenase